MSSSKVNEGLEDELSIFGFEVVPWRTLALNLCILLTAGLLWLPLYWVPRWKLLLTHRRVTLDKATSVLIEVRDDDRWNSCRCEILSSFFAGSF